MTETTYIQRRSSVSGDAQLVKAAQMGDAASLGALLERHRVPLYTIALNMLGYGPQAEDAVQDTFLVALSSIDRLREPKAVVGWLHSILRNLCYTRLRMRRKDVPLHEPHAQLGREQYEPSTERAIEQLALRDWVWTALSELPEALRVTAILRYFGSYPSYEEISTIMGVPVGTVKSRLHQVKVKLAGVLLKTAGLDHDEARRLAETQTRYMTEAFEAYTRGRLGGFTAFLSEDAVAVLPGMTVLRGRQNLVADLRRRMEEDLEDGVQMHLANVLASKDVIVVEGTFENPPDDPFHCPPAMAEVHLQRDGLTDRVHRYYAPRPGTQPTEDTQDLEAQ
jgi:RNA polymerase sigma factor (sigma-70 family)